MSSHGKLWQGVGAGVRGTGRVALGLHLSSKRVETACRCSDDATERGSCFSHGSSHSEFTWPACGFCPKMSWLSAFSSWLDLSVDRWLSSSPSHCGKSKLSSHRTNRARRAGSHLAMTLPPPMLQQILPNAGTSARSPYSPCLYGGVRLASHCLSS